MVDLGEKRNNMRMENNHLNSDEVTLMSFTLLKHVDVLREL